MTRAEIIEKIRQTVVESFPDMENVELNEDSVINTDTAIDSHRKWAKLQTMGDVADAIEKAMQK